MKVQSIIQPSATVVRVTEVAKGDVYKRLDTPTYGTEKMVFGVVTDVLHNGEDTGLVAMEFNPVGYGGAVAPTLKVFKGDAEVALFPATVEEYLTELGRATEQHRRAVDTAAKELAAMQAVLTTMEDTRDRTDLTPPLLVAAISEA